MKRGNYDWCTYNNLSYTLCSNQILSNLASSLTNSINVCRRNLNMKNYKSEITGHLNSASFIAEGHLNSGELAKPSSASYKAAYELLNSGGITGEWYVQRKKTLWERILTIFK